MSDEGEITSCDGAFCDEAWGKFGEGPNNIEITDMVADNDFRGFCI